ncbi:hypothetical protein ACF0H5_003378 [Mactra antiquata]
MESIMKIVILFFWIPLIQGRHWCVRYKPGTTETPEKIWCDTGCCGHGNETHCCLVKSEFEIVEGVLGALGGFFIILTIIVTFFCCRSHYKKSKRHQSAIPSVSSGIVTEIKIIQPAKVT